MNEQLINNGMVIDTDQKNQEIDSYPIQMQDSINYINNNLDKSTYLDINDFVDEKDKENKSLANDGDINGGNNNDKFPLMLDITHNENELTTGNILIEADENDKVNDGNGIDMDIHLSIAELKQQLSEINSHENDDNETNKTLFELESPNSDNDEQSQDLTGIVLEIQDHETEDENDTVNGNINERAEKQMDVFDRLPSKFKKYFDILTRLQDYRCKLLKLIQYQATKILDGSRNGINDIINKINYEQNLISKHLKRFENFTSKKK
eukprot:277007_1